MLRSASSVNESRMGMSPGFRWLALALSGKWCIAHFQWTRSSAVQCDQPIHKHKTSLFCSYCSHNLIEQVLVTVVDHTHGKHIEYLRSQLRWPAHDLIVNFSSIWDSNCGKQPMISTDSPSRWQKRRSCELEARHHRWMLQLNALQDPSRMCLRERSRQ